MKYSELNIFEANLLYVYFEVLLLNCTYIKIKTCSNNFLGSDTQKKKPMKKD